MADDYSNRNCLADTYLSLTWDLADTDSISFRDLFKESLRFYWTTIPQNFQSLPFEVLLEDEFDALKKLFLERASNMEMGSSNVNTSLIDTRSI